MNTLVRLCKDKRQRGSDMPLLKYNLIKEYIFHTLETFRTIDINQLLDYFFQEFPKEDKNSLARAVLEVKKDLEIRGLLKITFEPDRMQYISLTKKYCATSNAI